MFHVPTAQNTNRVFMLSWKFKMTSNGKSLIHSDTAVDF